jgi:hypothetical protein
MHGPTNVKFAGFYFQFNCDCFFPHYFHLSVHCRPVIRLYTVRGTNGMAGCSAYKYSATICRVLPKVRCISVCVICVEVKRRKALFFLNALPSRLIFLLHSKHDDESIRAPNKCLNFIKFRGSGDEVLSCQPPERCNQYGRHDTRLASKKEELRQQSDKGHMQRMELTSSGMPGQQVPTQRLYLSTALSNFVSKDSNLHIHSCEDLRSHIIRLYILSTYLSKNYRYLFWPCISSSIRIQSVELTGRWTDRDMWSLTQLFLTKTVY